GVADGCDSGENNDLLVEPAGNGGLLRRARGRAVLSPEVDFVAGIERGMDQILIRPTPIAETFHETGKINRGKQRRAGDLRLRVGLQNPADGRSDVEISDLRLLDQIG